MVKLDIAGIQIYLDTHNKNRRRLVPFYTKSSKIPSIKVCYSSAQNIPEPDCKMLLDDKIKWYCSLDERKDITVCLHRNDTDEIVSIMKVDNQWENALITYVGRNLDNLIITGPLGEILFRNRLLFYNGIMIHAAAIEYDGKGLMFCAPSGTGKSTQAELWRNYLGAEILNGDRSVIRMFENQSFVYGSPWCGSSAQYVNKRSPLNAIVMLEQAKTNELRLLDSKEALLKLLPRCFLPYYDDNGKMMDMAFETIHKIVSSTSIYLLKCKPDREAVELVYQCIR